MIEQYSIMQIVVEDLYAGGCMRCAVHLFALHKSQGLSLRIQWICMILCEALKIPSNVHIYKQRWKDWLFKGLLDDRIIRGIWVLQNCLEHTKHKGIKREAFEGLNDTLKTLIRIKNRSKSSWSTKLACETDGYPSSQKFPFREKHTYLMGDCRV